MENWIYNNKPIESLNELPEDAKYIIYEITLVDSKTDESFKYIGYKGLYTRRKKHFGKKKLAEMTDKRKKTYEYVVKESNWKTYCGSSKVVKEKIKQNPNLLIYRLILETATEEDYRYKEAKWLFMYDILNNDSYLNNNILGKFYKKTKK